MRTCEEITELISARLDGALSPAEEAELEEHLQGCEECRALAGDLAGLHDLMPGLNVEPPPALLQGVMEQIRAETLVPFPDEAARRKVRARKWRGWGAAAAVLAVVIFGATNLHLFGGGSGGEAAPMLMSGSAAAGGEERSINAALSPAEGACGESVPSTAPEFSTAQDAALPQDGAVPQPSAAPEAADAPGISAMDAGRSSSLTPEGALELLYETRFAQDYPDAEYTLGEGFEGYTLSPLAPVEKGGSLMSAEYLAAKGRSGNGAYYLFELYTQTVDSSGGAVVSETVLDRWAVPLAGGDILSQQDGEDAFSAAVGE